VSLERGGVEADWIHIAVGFAVTPDGGLERRAGGTTNRVRVWEWVDGTLELVGSGTAPTALSDWDPENPYPLLVIVEVDPGYWMARAPHCGAGLREPAVWDGPTEFCLRRRIDRDDRGKLVSA
jgi:hypothetical protein